MSEDVNPYRSPPNNNAAPESRSDPEAGEPMYGRVVSIASFTEAFDAQMLRNELVANGINATVTNDQSSVFGATTMGEAFTIDVMVMATDVEEGVKIKDRWLAMRNGEDSDTETDIPEWTCGCGETVDAGFEICWSCGAPYGGDEAS